MTEDSQKYNVVFNSVRTGIMPSDAEAKLGALFNVTSVQIKSLVQSSGLIIKKSVDFDVAIKYKLAIEAAGGNCELVLIKPPEKLDFDLPKYPALVESAHVKNSMDDFMSVETPRASNSSASPPAAAKTNKTNLYWWAAAVLVIGAKGVSYVSKSADTVRGNEAATQTKSVPGPATTSASAANPFSDTAWDCSAAPRDPDNRPSVKSFSASGQWVEEKKGNPTGSNFMLRASERRWGSYSVVNGALLIRQDYWQKFGATTEDVLLLKSMGLREAPMKTDLFYKSDFQISGDRFSYKVVWGSFNGNSHNYTIGDDMPTHTCTRIK